MTPLSRASTASEAPRVNPWNIESVSLRRRSTAAREAETAEALKFFAWCYAKGDKMAEELDYVPMPDNVVNDIQKMWSADIKDTGGKPLFSPTN